MDVERWRRVQELFEAAADLPAAEQQAFLARECGGGEGGGDDGGGGAAGGDGELRREVEALLRSDVEAGTFIEQAIRRGSDLLLAATEPDPLEAIGRIGKYEILGRIGEGGFGIVYKGRDPVLQRYVAVKTCSSSDEKLRRRFFREGQIAAGLQHPNITTVHDLGVERGIPYLVQEFLEGEDLNYKIARREALTLLQRLDLLAQVARGLEYAHRQGVLHRDIKPANIRSLPDGAVKIMDFGIAKLLHEVSDVTTQGVTLGTVGYLAPEQLRGGEVDRRTDIFSFGVLAYEVLAYERPFKGSTFSEVSYRLLNEEPRELAALAPTSVVVAGVVGRCLAKDPAARPDSFAEVLAAIEPEIEALRSGAFVVMAEVERPAAAAGAVGGSAGGAARAAAGGGARGAAEGAVGVPGEGVGGAWQRWRRNALGGIAAAGVVVAALAASGWMALRWSAPPAGAGSAAAPAPGDAARPGQTAGNRPRARASGAVPADLAAAATAGQGSGAVPVKGGVMVPVPGGAAVPAQRGGPAAAPPKALPRIDTLPQDRPSTMPPALAGGGGRASAAAAAAGTAAVPGSGGGAADSLPFERLAAAGGSPPGMAPPPAVGAPVAGSGSAMAATAGTPARATGPLPPAAGGGSGAAAEPRAAAASAGGVSGSAGVGGGSSGSGAAAEGSGAGSQPMARGDLILPGAAGVVVPPRLVSRPDPIYPDRARRRQVEGEVMILVLVDESGRVVQAIVKGTDDPGALGFNQAARRAALLAVFEPAQRDGIAGKMWTELPFSFRLHPSG